MILICVYIKQYDFTKVHNIFLTANIMQRKVKLSESEYAAYKDAKRPFLHFETGVLEINWFCQSPEWDFRTRWLQIVSKNVIWHRTSQKEQEP